MEPTSLYVHVPFCSGKCFYCDFYSIPAERGIIEKYFSALQREINLIREKYFQSQKPLLETIYFGGGTPTALGESQLSKLCAIVNENFEKIHNYEWTSEANPESVTAEKIKILMSSGVNRISIGAQTFDDQLLKVIGRRHDTKQTLTSLEIISKTGVSNIGLDLIYALPDQTQEQFKKDLEIAIKLPVKHISCYELTLEPGSRLTFRAEEEKQEKMFVLAHDFLTNSGFQHYEISNYCKPNFESRHNMRYWKNLDYIGIGPSASGFINRRRYKNISNISEYCQKDLPVESEETLSDLKFAGETAMLALRTANGINGIEFKKQTGYDAFILFKDKIEKYKNLNLLDVTEETISIKQRSFILSNEILADFLQ